MGEIPTHPENLMNPIVPAIVAQLVALWLNKYLKDWRFKDLLTLALTTLIMLSAWVVIPTPLTWPDLWSVLWLSLLGASVATFGYETVTNLLGLINAGPRATSVQAMRQSLGRLWR